MANYHGEKIFIPNLHKRIIEWTKLFNRIMSLLWYIIFLIFVYWMFISWKSWPVGLLSQKDSQSGKLYVREWYKKVLLWIPMVKCSIYFKERLPQGRIRIVFAYTCRRTYCFVVIIASSISYNPWKASINYKYLCVWCRCFLTTILMGLST